MWPPRGGRGAIPSGGNVAHRVPIRAPPTPPWHIVLDMKLPSAQAALKRLASTADVFIENSRPGAFDRMGLSYEDMKAVNPNLIYVSISGFGSTGPYAGRPACKSGCLPQCASRLPRHHSFEQLHGFGVPPR